MTMVTRMTMAIVSGHHRPRKVTVHASGWRAPAETRCDRLGVVGTSAVPSPVRSPRRSSRGGSRHLCHRPAVFPGFSCNRLVSATLLPVPLFRAFTGLALINAGVEARYHLAPGSSYGPHVGAGGGLLNGVAEGSASSGAWIWANAAVTFNLGPALRLEIEAPGCMLGLAGHAAKCRRAPSKRRDLVRLR